MKGRTKRKFGRIIIGDSKVYLIFVEGDEKLDVDDAKSLKFFEKFEIKKK